MPYIRVRFYAYSKAINMHNNYAIFFSLKPNLFIKYLFGQLYLNEYSSNDPFKSRILSEQQSFDIIQLCEFSFKVK
jgi:hypothetical protein